MKIIVSDNYEELSKNAAEDIIESLQSIKEPLVCTASGDSPAGLYKVLVQKVLNNELNLSDWNFVGLDEWVGMNEEDEGSCKFHLNNQFFFPLKISGEKICFFNGRSKDLNKECEITEDFIKKHNGINVAIVGLGLNGHVGMNEPGTPLTIRSHVANIDQQTQEVGQKYFEQKGFQNLSKGLTLGIANLMEAKKIVLIVSGSHKANIVQKILGKKISEQLPASLLRNHPGLTLYLDKAAAILIEH